MNLLKKLMGIDTEKDKAAQITEINKFHSIPQEMYPDHIFTPNLKDVIAKEVRDGNGNVKGGNVYEQQFGGKPEIHVASYDAEQWKVFQKDLEAAKEKAEIENLKKMHGDKAFEYDNQRIIVGSVTNENGVRTITEAIPVMRIKEDKMVNYGANIYTKDKIVSDGAGVSQGTKKVKTVGSAEWNNIVEANAQAQSKLKMNAKATTK